MRAGIVLFAHLVLALCACGGRVVVDEDPGPRTDVDFGAGGADVFCRNVCETINEVKGPGCSGVDPCLLECVPPYHGAEAMGCLDEYTAIWICGVERIHEMTVCTTECLEENLAYGTCYQEHTGQP